MSNSLNDKAVPPPVPPKTRAETPDRVLLVPYPKIVFLYPTFLVAIIAAIWDAFTRKALQPGQPHRRGQSARCSWGCSP